MNLMNDDDIDHLDGIVEGRILRGSPENYRASIQYKGLAHRYDRNMASMSYEIKRARALWDPDLEGWRCPPGTTNGGDFTDRFGRNCGWGVTRRIANAITDTGERLENALEKRRIAKANRKGKPKKRRLGKPAERISSRGRRVGAEAGRRVVPRTTRTRRGEDGTPERMDRTADEVLQGNFLENFRKRRAARRAQREAEKAKRPKVQRGRRGRNIPERLERAADDVLSGNFLERRRKRRETNRRRRETAQAGRTVPSGGNRRPSSPGRPAPSTPRPRRTTGPRVNTGASGSARRKEAEKALKDERDANYDFWKSRLRGKEVNAENIRAYVAEREQRGTLTPAYLNTLRARERDHEILNSDNAIDRLDELSPAARKRIVKRVDAADTVALPTPPTPAPPTPAPPAPAPAPNRPTPAPAPPTPAPNRPTPAPAPPTPAPNRPTPNRPTPAPAPNPSTPQPPPPYTPPPSPGPVNPTLADISDDKKERQNAKKRIDEVVAALSRANDRRRLDLTMRDASEEKHQKEIEKARQAIKDSEEIVGNRFADIFDRLLEKQKAEENQKHLDYLNRLLAEKKLANANARDRAAQELAERQRAEEAAREAERVAREAEAAAQNEPEPPTPEPRPATPRTPGTGRRTNTFGLDKDQMDQADRYVESEKTSWENQKNEIDAILSRDGSRDEGNKLLKRRIAEIEEAIDDFQADIDDEDADPSDRYLATRLIASAEAHRDALRSLKGEPSPEPTPEPVAYVPAAPPRNPLPEPDPNDPDDLIPNPKDRARLRSEFEERSKPILARRIKTIGDYLKDRYGKDDSPWNDPAQNLTLDQMKDLIETAKSGTITEKAEANQKLTEWAKRIYELPEFEGRDGKKYRTVVSEARGTVTNHVGITGSIQAMDANGNWRNIGSFTRHVAPSGIGYGPTPDTPAVINSYLKITSAEHKNSGFASVFNPHAFTWMKAAGIKKAKVSADWDGKFVWGKLGFRQNSAQSKAIALKLEAEIKKIRAGGRSSVINKRDADLIAMLLDEARRKNYSVDAPQHPEYLLAMGNRDKRNVKGWFTKNAAFTSGDFPFDEIPDDPRK